jgi:hypothetical protein
MNDPRLTAALTALDTAAAGKSDERQLLVVAKCRGLMAGYQARWGAAGYAPEAVEDLVISDLWNPETQRRSRSFRIAGKLDTTGYSGRRVLFDHKSTSEDITDPNAPYWRQLVIEGQVSHYMLLEWLNGRKVDEAVWDVMRKPGISPKNVTKAEVTFTLSHGRYFGREMSKAALAELRESGRENLEMYEARLAYDCSTERPNWYFERRSVPRLDADLHEYASELWGHSQEILHARRENRWPRNSGACMLYGSPCRFLGICSGYDTPESDNWRRKQSVHAELPMLDGDGRDVLTNSRIRCFQTCRRKHFYDYELGIERQDEEEREALFFGNVWHLALEAWFNASKGDVSGNNSNDAPANAVGTVADSNEAPVYF